jgi:sulfoxide reductase catalytic subunit YedY
MLLKFRKEIPSSEITPKETYERFNAGRRRFLEGAAAAGAVAAAGAMIPRSAWADNPPPLSLAKINNLVETKYSVSDTTTPPPVARGYNNFYEFGEQKSDPAKNAWKMHVSPWSVRVEGLVKQPQTIDVEKIYGYRPIEQRTYRFRCVEAWSMVIPWDGYPLSDLIQFANPLPSAKYVQFLSLKDPKTMELPYGIEFPYSEGLRMDEAMHPLTLLTFGSYGETLANQQGAPIRVIVPWKYGFKSAKSIVTIRFTDKQPKTTWNDMAPDEYGFYSNVNPKVDHPRWTQSRERLLNSNSILPHWRQTEMFNGYSEVASLYSGMDLKKDF